MKPSPRENAEVALSECQTVTVNQHWLFIDSMLTEADCDEIDALVKDLRAAEFEGKGARP